MIARYRKTAVRVVPLKAFVLALLLFSLVPVLSTGLPGGGGIGPGKAHASDWRSKVKSSFKKSRKTFSNVKRNIERKSRNAVRTYKKKKSYTKKKIANQWKKKQRKISGNLKNYRKKAKSLGKRYGSSRKKFTNTVRKKTVRSIMAGMPRGVSRRTVRSLGSGLRHRVRGITRRYGAAAGTAAAIFLSRNGRSGARILARSRPAIRAAVAYSRNPRTQRRAVAAILIAASAGYAVYRHQDDIKYAVASKVLDDVRVPVNGRTVSANTVWRDAVLKRAPFLRGTDIAEDPAKIIAYGLVGTATSDLAYRLEIVPDGKGGVTTVARAIERSDDSDRALAALQLQSTMEGAAIETMRSGRLGPSAALFATAYYDTSTRIDSSAR